MQVLNPEWDWPGRRGGKAADWRGASSRQRAAGRLGHCRCVSKCEVSMEAMRLQVQGSDCRALFRPRGVVVRFVLCEDDNQTVSQRAGLRASCPNQWPGSPSAQLPISPEATPMSCPGPLFSRSRLQANPHLVTCPFFTCAHTLGEAVVASFL